MGVSVEHQTGDGGVKAEVTAVIEHVLADRPGDWQVIIIGSPANDQWEMTITRPNAFERSYTLEGRAGEHRSETIGDSRENGAALLKPHDPAPKAFR